MVAADYGRNKLDVYDFADPPVLASVHRFKMTPRAYVEKYSPVGFVTERSAGSYEDDVEYNAWLRSAEASGSYVLLTDQKGTSHRTKNAGVVTRASMGRNKTPDDDKHAVLAIAAWALGPRGDGCTTLMAPHPRAPSKWAAESPLRYAHEQAKRMSAGGWSGKNPLVQLPMNAAPPFDVIDEDVRTVVGHRGKRGWLGYEPSVISWVMAACEEAAQRGYGQRAFVERTLGLHAFGRRGYYRAQAHNRVRTLFVQAWREAHPHADVKISRGHVRGVADADITTGQGPWFDKLRIACCTIYAFYLSSRNSDTHQRNISTARTSLSPKSELSHPTAEQMHGSATPSSLPSELPHPSEEPMSGRQPDGMIYKLPLPVVG